jgi:hypothetical protein
VQKYSELNGYSLVLKDIWHMKILEDGVQGDSGKFTAFNTDADYAADTPYNTIHYQ